MLSNGLDNRGGQTRFKSVRHERRRVAEHLVLAELTSSSGTRLQRTPMDFMAESLFAAILKEGRSLASQAISLRSGRHAWGDYPDDPIGL